MKTVLITGASAGIGHATALYFAQHGWNVVATMRRPEQETELAKLPNVLVTKLDVLDEASIQAAVAASVARFGRIDALVNNAGYGLAGPFEAATQEQIKRQFDTNLFGLLNVTRAVLPHFRQQKSGVLLNVASIGGRLGSPLYSLYQSTKWAVEGFSEALMYELKPKNIRVRIIEPGAIQTEFQGRSEEVVKHPDYTAYENLVWPNLYNAGKKGGQPIDVAKGIFKAANSTGWRLRYPVGGGAPMLMWLRRHLPESWFFGIVRSMLEKKPKRK